MSISVNPINLALGAEIRGVDLRLNLDEATVARIKGVLDERSVIVFRRQSVGPNDMIRFAQCFGKLLMHGHNEPTVDGFPEVAILSNIVENGRNVGNPEAGAHWHTDGSYLQNPDMYTFLFGVEIPERDGLTLGNTFFASTAAAYDALDASMKSKIERLRAVHGFSAKRLKKMAMGGAISEESQAASAEVEHPVVRVHPITRRKCIYVTENHTKRIVGLEPDDSKQLLRELEEHIHQPQFVYRHEWHVGDLVVWDNCATQHRATLDYALPLRRRMHRTATAGGPVLTH